MKHAKEESNENNDKEDKRLWIGLVITLILLLIGISTWFLYYTNTEEYVNGKMTELVTEYFETNIKDNAAGVGRLMVTLQTLEDAGYNIGAIEGKKGVSGDAFSYVIIENPEELDVSKITYIIENHLYEEK